MYDITVDEVHTFYVLAGSDAVLVHNCPPIDDHIGEPGRGFNLGQVRANGTQYFDTETGNTVYVQGNRAVVDWPNGENLTGFTGTKSNFAERISSGRWVPWEDKP